jgi:hypothetical protein
MLLTAQRVISPHLRARGVNVFQYLHGPNSWERVPNNFLPEANPGELVAQWIQVPPGGNRVVSFLDVVAPDEIDGVDLQQRLTSLKHRLQFSETATAVYWDPLWIRFGCAALPVPPATELGALAGHIVLRLSGVQQQQFARSR